MFLESLIALTCGEINIDRQACLKSFEAATKQGDVWQLSEKSENFLLSEAYTFVGSPSREIAGASVYVYKVIKDKHISLSTKRILDIPITVNATTTSGSISINLPVFK